MAWGGQGIRRASPSPEIQVQSFVVFSMFLLLSHLLKINSGGGQESGVTHTHKDVHGRQRRQKRSIKPKTRTEFIAFLGIIDIK